MLAQFPATSVSSGQERCLCPKRASMVQRAINMDRSSGKGLGCDAQSLGDDFDHRFLVWLEVLAAQGGIPTGQRILDAAALPASSSITARPQNGA